MKLLRHYNFDYHSFGKYKKGLFKNLEFNFFRNKVHENGLKIKPDIILSGGAMFAAHSSFIFRIPNITFNNTDIDFQIKLNKPFTSFFLTSDSYKMELGAKHYKYRGYQELTFLHPKYFHPNINTIKKLGLSETDKYVLLRFVSWETHDDFGKSGFSIEDIRKIVTEFSKYSKIFISCEYNLPEDLRKFHPESNPNIETGDLQDIEYYATLFYGESGAMAAECAVLGTPASYISSKQLGFIEELESKYQLVLNRNAMEGNLTEAVNLLNSKDIKKIWREKSSKMIEDNINVTDFFLWFVENYPSSKQLLKSNPKYQFNFR